MTKHKNYRTHNPGLTPADQGIRAAKQDDLERNGLRGADLAGACEGEQIADLIEFVISVATETDLAGGTLRERAEDAEGQLAILRDRAIKMRAEILRRYHEQN